MRMQGEGLAGRQRRSFRGDGILCLEPLGLGSTHAGALRLAEAAKKK
jgi:hypothetical protein